MALLWLAAVMLLAPPAFADDCKPLERLVTLDMTPLPGGARVLVPATINGATKNLLLDTGGGRTTLNQAATETLNLNVLDSEYERLLDADGYASNRYFDVSDFALGKLQGRQLQFMVTPNPHAGADPQFDGILALDLMGAFDVEMDFAARKLTYFSPNHCTGHVVYWPAQAVAVTPFTQNRQAREPLGFGMLGDAHTTHIRVPVTLDGKDFFADINTASGDSTMTAATAKYVFGVTADSPGAVPLGQMGSDPADKRFGYVFKSLTFDGISVTNAHFIVIPDLTGAKDRENEYATGGHLQRADDGIASEITVGMDVLKHLHLYIAYGEKKLYLTPASPPPAAAKP